MLCCGGQDVIFFNGPEVDGVGLVKAVESLRAGTTKIKGLHEDCREGLELKDIVHASSRSEQEQQKSSWCFNPGQNKLNRTVAASVVAHDLEPPTVLS